MFQIGVSMVAASEAELLNELREWKAHGNSLNKLLVVKPVSDGIQLAVPRYNNGQHIACWPTMPSYAAAYAAYGEMLDKVLGC